MQSMFNSVVLTLINYHLLYMLWLLLLFVYDEYELSECQ